MAPGRNARGKGLGAIRSTGSETLQLVVDYVKQETLDPLKGLGRYILFGVAGSVVLSIGLVILAVAFLRVLQGETGHCGQSRQQGAGADCRRHREGEAMSPAGQKITRDDIEAKFRELTGEVSQEVASTRSQAITVGLAVGVALVAVVFLIGRRNGRRRSAVVEVRRI